MPLENILQTLETEAARQIEAIEQATEAEIERIQAQAQVRVEAARQQRLAAIQAPLQFERARIINRAKLKALQVVLGTREDLMTAALETTAQRLAALSNLDEYTQLLQLLLQEAVETLGVSGELHLQVIGQDEVLMQQIIKEVGIQATVAGDLESEGAWGVDLGGVIVTTSDGRVSLVNTLEARLQRVASLYRSRIAELIFGGVA